MFCFRERIRYDKREEKRGCECCVEARATSVPIKTENVGIKKYCLCIVRLPRRP